MSFGGVSVTQFVNLSREKNYFKVSHSSHFISLNRRSLFFFSLVIMDLHVFIKHRIIHYYTQLILNNNLEMVK